MEPIAKAVIAVFGGNGDCGFLKSFQCLKKSRPVADGHFSIESEKTEHGFTVNYAKYEYVEWMDMSLPDLRFNRNDIPTRFTFVEFATWDDAMKAMWDGFPLGFTAFICTFFPDRDPEEAYDQMGRHITKHESIMAGTKVPYLWLLWTKMCIHLMVIRKPLLPGQVRTMRVHLDEGVGHVNKTATLW